ncbi:unnamed protein product [Arabidopsis lyrata]|uniref:Uncharacterized protein n=1 Tax=Arabidopsis lyrata subsp. lyrata TaxID=81972 RepID=D7MLX9_ARALL|nr:uncharacterized protein LOC9302807 [Arabidopsis lyrata subsp. lyrata]EFH42994.1 hypothetical protein ARALYDRAFT_920041 [Arabidopsis lyrata subsp. lyrata]CAH8281057.1 unnamed protein product [Arabidopsis lyrata]|eukprot:XP_002866735.1 uncharacterized protein LOC9302807 [Arabidopsis lyrata subsp. lyrata]
MESSMGQKKTLYACIFLMMVFFLGFNCGHGRTLKVDDKIDGGHDDSKTMMALAKHNVMMVDDKTVQFSPPPPPPSPSQSGGKEAEDFRPTTPGHSPGIGHSLSHN